MLGAIIGDVVGSVYEFDNIKSEKFPLLSAGSTFTDDSVMMLAVVDGFMAAFEDCVPISAVLVGAIFGPGAYDHPLGVSSTHLPLTFLTSLM